MKTANALGLYLILQLKLCLIIQVLEDGYSTSFFSLMVFSVMMNIIVPVFSYVEGPSSFVLGFFKMCNQTISLSGWACCPSSFHTLRKFLMLFFSFLSVFLLRHYQHVFQALSSTLPIAPLIPFSFRRL